MESIPRTSGIYQILCVPTGKVYIGSAVNLWNRHRLHFNDLRRKSNRAHHSRYLQRAWDKYGEDAFVFSVLEFCDRDQLLEREQYYLDLYQPYEADKGYNTARIAGSSVGISPSAEARRKRSALMKGRRTRGPLSEDARRRISESAKGNTRWLGRKHTAETIEKQRKVVRLNQHTYRKPETGDHVSAAKAKPISGFISPDGEPVTIENMRSFCAEHGLKKSAMYCLVLGKQIQHQGWRHVNARKASK